MEMEILITNGPSREDLFDSLRLGNKVEFETPDGKYRKLCLRGWGFIKSLKSLDSVRQTWEVGYDSTVTTLIYSTVSRKGSVLGSNILSADVPSVKVLNAPEFNLHYPLSPEEIVTLLNLARIGSSSVLGGVSKYLCHAVPNTTWPNPTAEVKEKHQKILQFFNEIKTFTPTEETVNRFIELMK